MQKVLLLGGSGFIGRNIIEYFKDSKEYEIVAPSSRELNVINEEEVCEYLRKQYFNIVLHFAVYGDLIDKTKDGAKVLEYNLRMFLNFEKNSCLYGKMYYAGTGAEYNKAFDIVDVKEDEIGMTIPTDQYGLMRYTIDKIIRKSYNIYGLKIFGIYGKYEMWERRFISNCCCRAIKNLPLAIRQNLYFDYIWIEDFLNILKMLMDNTPNEHVLNVTSGKKVDLLSLARIVKDISKKEVPIIVCKDGLGKEYTSDNTNLLKEIGEYDFTDYETAIRYLYEWYVDNEEIIDIAKLLY